MLLNVFEGLALAIRKTVPLDEDIPSNGQLATFFDFI